MSSIHYKSIILGVLWLKMWRDEISPVGDLAVFLASIAEFFQFWNIPINFNYNDIMNTMSDCGLPVTICFVDEISRKNSIWSLLLVISCSCSKNRVISCGQILHWNCWRRSLMAMPMFVAKITDQNLRRKLLDSTYVIMLIGFSIVYVVVNSLYTPRYLLWWVFVSITQRV